MIAAGKHIKNTLAVLLPLTIGSLLYILFRAEKPMYLAWLKNFGSTSYRPGFVDWLPDYLWLLSLLTVLSLIWKGWKNIPFAWLAVVWIGVVASEMLQYYHIIFGTFDWKDIIAYQLAFLTIIIINRKSLL